MNEILRPSGQFNREVVFIIAFITLCVLAYTRRYFGVRLYRHWQAFWNFRLAMQYMREDNSKSSISLAFGSISVCIVTLALCAAYNNVCDWLGLTWTHSTITAAFAVAITATWLRSIWILLLQFISGGIRGLNEYAFCLRVSFLVQGVVLFLPSLCAVFGEPQWRVFFSVLILLIMLIAQLIQWVRGVQIAIFHNIPLYYLFFYICTLEILPAALVIKFFFA